MYVTEFRRTRKLPVLALAGSAFALVGAANAETWMLVLAGITVPLGIADTWWQLRTPLLRFTPSEIVIHIALLRRTRRLAFAEVAAWAHSDAWLAFDTLHSERIRIHLMPIPKSERVRLVEHLDALSLGQPGFAGINADDLASRMRRSLIFWILGTLLVVAATVWFVLHMGVEP